MWLSNREREMIGKTVIVSDPIMPDDVIGTIIGRTANPLGREMWTVRTAPGKKVVVALHDLKEPA